jgi:hypothetical protein
MPSTEPPNPFEKFSDGKFFNTIRRLLPPAVVKKWIGHGSAEMVARYTHLRPDFMQDELARVPDIVSEFGPKVAELTRLTLGLRLRHDVNIVFTTGPGSSNR